MKIIGNLVTVGVICLQVTIALGQAGHSSRSAEWEELLDRQVSIPLLGNERIGSAFMNALIHVQAPGGIVNVLNCGPEVRHKFPGGSLSLREALNTIVSADPANRWEVKDGVVNLIPVYKLPELLNLRIAEFNAENASTVLEALEQLLKLPEVQERIAQLHLEELRKEPGLVDLKRPGSIPDKPKPGLNIHCKKSTLRGVLNSIARAHGSAIWDYTEQYCDGRHGFSIGFMMR